MCLATLLCSGAPKAAAKRDTCPRTKHFRAWLTLASIVILSYAPSCKLGRRTIATLVESLEEEARMSQVHQPNLGWLIP